MDHPAVTVILPVFNEIDTIDETRPARPSAPPRMLRRGIAWRGWPLIAAAACVALAWGGASIWSLPESETQLSEAELAQLDADVELALTRLGLVLHQAERITTIDVFGANRPKTTVD